MVFTILNRTLLKGTRLLAATHNRGKAKEIAELLDGRFEVIMPDQVGLSEPEETETSFEGNARLKALNGALKCNEVTIADDSGLSVEALGGAPGIYSARWAGETRDFSVAFARIEQELKEKSARAPHMAYFTCCLAIAWPDGACVSFEGRVDGALCFPPRGDYGFGYDPIFVPSGGSLSFGEMLPSQKDAMSHRTKAFEKLKAALF